MVVARRSRHSRLANRNIRRQAALEDAEDYKEFEAAIIADYDAQSAGERELLSHRTGNHAGGHRSNWKGDGIYASPR